MEDEFFISLEEVDKNKNVIWGKNDKYAVFRSASKYSPLRVIKPVIQGHFNQAYNWGESREPDYDYYMNNSAETVDEWASGNFDYRVGYLTHFVVSSPLNRREYESETVLSSVKEGIQNRGKGRAIGLSRLDKIEFLKCLDVIVSDLKGRAAWSAIGLTEKGEVSLTARNNPWIEEHHCEGSGDYFDADEEFFIKKCLNYDSYLRPELINPLLAKCWNISDGAPSSLKELNAKWGSWENMLQACNFPIFNLDKSTIWNIQYWLEVSRWDYSNIEPDWTDFRFFEFGFETKIKDPTFAEIKGLDCSEETKKELLQEIEDVRKLRK